MRRSLGSWHVGSRTPGLMSFQLGPKRCGKREIFGFECRCSPIVHYTVGRDDLMIHVKRRWKTAGAFSAVFPATKQYPWTMFIMITCSLLKITELYCFNACTGFFKNLMSWLLCYFLVLFGYLNSWCRNIALRNMCRLEKHNEHKDYCTKLQGCKTELSANMKFNAICQTRQRIEAAMGLSVFVGLEIDVIDWVYMLVASVVIVIYNLTRAGAALCVVRVL